MAYRSSVHESTGFSPYRLMFEEECTLPMDCRLDGSISCDVLSRLGSWHSETSGLTHSIGSLAGLEKVPQPSGLMLWIKAPRPEGAPTIPVLGASTVAFEGFVLYAGGDCTL